MNFKSSMAQWPSSSWRTFTEFFEKTKMKAGVQQKVDELQLDDFAHIFRQKTRSELVRISAAVMGIEFCYAAETAFVSPTLLKIGVRHSHLPLIWCLSPLIGFFMTPILGSLSDRCNSRLGKRRPFILGLSIGIILGLIFVPNGKDIGIGLGDWYSWQDSGLHRNSSPDNGQVNNSGPLISRAAFTPNASRGDKPSTMTPAGETSAHHPWGIFFTIVGTILLDFDADACQSPSRAYLLDITLAEDHAIGLSTFTIMAGLGGSLGYAMGAINWDVTSFGKKLGGQVRVVFTIILFIYVICVMITVFSFREIPLHVSEREKTLGNRQNTAHWQNSQKSAKKGRKSASRSGHYKKFVDEEIAEEDEEDEEGMPNKTSIRHSRMHNEKPNRLNESVHHLKSYGSMQADDGSPCFYRDNSEETSFISNAEFGESDANPSTTWQMLPVSKSDLNEEAILKIQSNTPTDFDVAQEPIVELKHYLYSIIFMPKSLRVLCLTNLFSWMSLVAYSLYFTDFVGEAVYKGDPRAVDGSSLKMQYEDGVRFGCLGMAAYSLSCSVYSLTIDKLIQTFGARPVYIGGHWIYSFGMLMLALSRHRAAVILLSCTSGVMYATLFTMPYLLVAHYHTNNKFDDKVVRGRVQVRGLGTDVAVVSSMLFLAQFTLSLCIGPLVNFTGSTITIVFIASFLSFCGGLCATQVMYFDL